MRNRNLKAFLNSSILTLIFFISPILIAQHNISNSVNDKGGLDQLAGPIPNLRYAKQHTIVNPIQNPATIAYGHNSQGGATLSMPIPAGTPWTTLSSWTPPIFASSMIKGGDGNYYITDVSPILFQFNTSTGVVTQIGAITGTSGDQINGISYNPANGGYYLISATNFYSLNISTRVATLIGNMGIAGSAFIDLCFNPAGVCYSYELTTDAAYIINISTGVATQLGVLGYDANFGQGMSYDMETNTIYLSAFNNTTFTGQLRTMNATTGATTLITDWGLAQIAPFAVNTQYGPDIVALVSPANNSTEIPTNLQLVWQEAAGAETYKVQGSLSSDFSTATFEIGSLTGTSFSLSGIAENTKYYWRVRGESGAIAGSWSEVWGFTTVSTINLNYTITFPSKDKAQDYQSSDYKIVGLPGKSDMDAKLILSGTQGTDWQLYWDNGQVDNYYSKYDVTSPFRFHLGKAYWIIRKGNLNISKTVEAAGLGTDGRVGIALLENNFNLITNPFTVPVDWTLVQQANGGLTEVIKTYNNGWANSDALEPYIGYLFDNQVADLPYLIIPYPTSSEKPLMMKKTDLVIWRVEVELTCGEFIDKTTSFGISTDALEGRDKFDLRKPRGMGNTPYVYFYHPEWDNGYGLFETDIRPEFEEQQTWDLKVYSEQRESVRLKFSGIEKIPSDMEIYLVDVDGAKYVNLRNQEGYEFTAVKTISDFQILVGKLEFINSKLNDLLPTEFELGNNFPNPFNPTTTVPLSIPHTADIKLIIYNILGQEVRVLYDGTLEPGKYWYQWDGKDNMNQAVPSGIYLYNFVSSNGINFSKKMVLIK